MRDPTDPGWPERGERTELREIAERWKWAYLALVRGEHRRRVLQLGPEPVPLKQACQAFLAHRRATQEKATWSADRTAIGHMLEHVPGTTLTSDVQTEHLQAMLNHMVGRGYRLTTLWTYRKSLWVFWDWVGGTNPCEGLELAKPPKRDVRTWSALEIQQLRAAADRVDEQLVWAPRACRMALELGICMGLRQGEIFALKWEDIDARGRTTRVQWQVPKDSKTPKHLKGKRARTTLVHPDWWTHHRPAIGLVLPGDDGKPLGTRSQRNIITRILDTAGLNEKGLGWHSTRHTYARRYLEGEGGVEPGSLEELQKFLGHSSIRTTESSYGHFRDDAAVRIGRGRLYG